MIEITVNSRNGKSLVTCWTVWRKEHRDDQIRRIHRANSRDGSGCSKFAPTPGRPPNLARSTPTYPPRKYTRLGVRAAGAIARVRRKLYAMTQRTQRVVHTQEARERCSASLLCLCIDRESLMHCTNFDTFLRNP